MALLQECVVGLIVCPSCAEDYGDLFSCSSQRGVNCLLLREENFQNVHAWMRLVRHKLLSLHWVNLSGCGQGDHRLEDRPEIIDLRAYQMVNKIYQPTSSRVLQSQYVR